MRARWPHSWAHLGHEWREATSDASNFREDGRRVATCDGSADHLYSWCSQWLQCCLYGPAHACPVTALSGGSGQGVLLATQGSWCANAVEGPSTPLTLHAHCTWYPILGLGREASAEAVLWRFSTAWYGTVRYGSVRIGLRFHRSLVPL